MFRFYLLFTCLLVIICNNFVTCHNKYSAEANKAPSTPAPPANDDEYDFRPVSLKHLDRPFRMAKLNLLWSKAVVRLSEPKLKSLLGELKLHDKEEITWKHLKAEGKDKDGIKEAELRKKLLHIMRDFNLLDQADDIQDANKYSGYKPLNEASDKHINKSIFKDKKLNKLWEKAETAGFAAEELAALKEEFNHHQDKVDQYYALLQDVKENERDDGASNSVDDNLDKFNTIEYLEEQDKSPNKDYLNKLNLLRERHRDIRDGYDQLFVRAAKGPINRDFIEPKVQGLWKMAIESNFTANELQSLKVELQHYENRLLKLRHMQAEQALKEDENKKKAMWAGGKTNGMLMMEENIKKHARKVEKLHLDIETKIMQKHIEL